MNRPAMTIIELGGRAILCSSASTVFRCWPPVTADAPSRGSAAVRYGRARHVMERMAARPWAELTPRPWPRTAVANARNLLPDVALKIEITPVTEPEGKRIAVPCNGTIAPGRRCPVDDNHLEIPRRQHPPLRLGERTPVRAASTLQPLPATTIHFPLTTSH